MEPPLIVEILDRFGKIRERIRIDKFPCRIGRGYHNDIIIDDPYVSPAHLELILDGNRNLILSDTSSENGTYSIHPVRRLDSIVVEDNQRVRIGHTELRLRSTQFPVRATVPDRGKPHGVVLRALTVLLTPVAWFLVSALLLWSTYLETATEVTFNQLLRNTLSVLIFIPLWAFAWSVVSKIVTHRFYFTFHLLWVSVLITVLYAIETGLQYAEFMSAIDFLADYAMLVTDVLFIAALFYGHLRYSTTYSSRKSLVIATITGLMFSAIIKLTDILAQPEFDSQPRYSGILKPPTFVVRDSKTIDAFFGDSAALKEFTYGNDDGNGGDN